MRIKAGGFEEIVNRLVAEVLSPLLEQEAASILSKIEIDKKAKIAKGTLVESKVTVAGVGDFVTRATLVVSLVRSREGGFFGASISISQSTSFDRRFGDPTPTFIGYRFYPVLDSKGTVDSSKGQWKFDYKR